MIFVTLLRIGSLNVFVLAGARFVAGSDTGTEAGAPPMTSRGIRREGHRPRCPRVQMFRACDVTGRDKPARQPALQVKMSRVRASRIIIAGTNATWNELGGRRPRRPQVQMFRRD
jgi:hypothetical protein